MRTGLHPDVWVNALFSNWKETSPPINNRRVIHEIQYPDWIIADVRFPNEAKAIKERNGILVRINRYPKTVLVHRPGMSIPDEVPFDHTNSKHIDLWNGECSHSSETALDRYDGFDEIIDNNGSLEELLEKARNLVTKFNLIK